MSLVILDDGGDALPTDTVGDHDELNTMGNCHQQGHREIFEGTRNHSG